MRRPPEPAEEIGNFGPGVGERVIPEDVRVLVDRSDSRRSAL